MAEEKNSNPFRVNLNSAEGSGKMDWAKAFEELENELPVGTPLPTSIPLPSTTAITPLPIKNVTPPTPIPTPSEPVNFGGATPIVVSAEASTGEGRVLSKYEEMIRTPSMKIEKADITVMTEFSKVIAKINEANRAVDELEKAFPDAIAERWILTWRDNLRETATVMMKEFHAMRNGRVQKKYDKRCVCVECHSVFMVPLPADGVCDSCRSAKSSKGGRY